MKFQTPTQSNGTIPDKVPIIPLADRILIIPDKSHEEITKAGLVLPEFVGDKPKSGLVVAVGDGKDGITMKVKRGDRVLFGKFAGYEMKMNDINYLIIREPDIFAILNE